MKNLLTVKEEFIRKRSKLFRSKEHFTDSLKFSLSYSLLVEEYIRTIAGNNKYHFTVVSAGSFSRRELSPYSDIDLIFIAESVDKYSEDISLLVKNLWDSGIEVSHTVRDFSDIEKFLHEDLHTFTQFFETRFLLGSESVYRKWHKALLNSLSDDTKAELIRSLIEDINRRFEKYGSSPKMLEPNVKLSAGGLRDFQCVEWMFVFFYKKFLNQQEELTQAEAFIREMKKDTLTTCTECRYLLESYKLVLGIRNALHLSAKQKKDRFEFQFQQKLSRHYYSRRNGLADFMKEYFKAANVINRFTRSMIKKFLDEITPSLPDSLSIQLDEDFSIKGRTISLSSPKELTFSDILRAFYYRGLHSARFDESLRSAIIESVLNHKSADVESSMSSVFFREIMKLPRNVGVTLSVMNELGVLGSFMPEFDDLNGFLQHGVYHYYTADEHTLRTIINVEKLEKDNSVLGRIFNRLRDKEILYLALLFHDIAKPINISGHEIIGAEMAASIMHRLGYSEEEIEKVSFLVKYHLFMEQVAFRRNLNDPETLNNFVSVFTSTEQLDLLYLVTYADLSAVNPAVWTTWKSELLSELYRKAKAMIEDQISGEDLLISTTYIIPKEISKHSVQISEEHVQEHIESINDIGYAHQFSDREIAQHIEEIRKGNKLSVIFKQLENYTNITVITNDYPSLLSKLCGVLAINDANIHDAKIFTRKDGIVIDTFNVSDFSSGEKLDESKFEKIREDFQNVITGLLRLSQEVAYMKSRWKRLEHKLFRRSGKINIAFENHEKYTIIDVFSPDRLGFLYHVTNKMNELGLLIFFAKISTKGDDIVDSFYVLDRNGKKISPSDQEFIISELTDTIAQIL
ncbi:MAG: [protein-PII] uridylyltransferase [Ignavibacteriaceae bacterium]